MALTDTTVRNAKPKEKPYKLGDSGGLFVIVRPNGAKWWRLKYRFAGKEKPLSVGTYPDVRLQAARRRRDECRQLIARGVNPSDQRKAKHAASMDNTADTFETVARYVGGRCPVPYRAAALSVPQLAHTGSRRDGLHDRADYGTR
jgi:hypothetical protein